MAKEIKVKKIPEGLSGITGKISKRKDTKKVRPRGYGGHPGKPFRKAGGQVIKKMGGGQIYNRGKGGKVIKSSNNGDQVVAGCYD